MCGIAGIISLSGSMIRVDELVPMSRAIAHRGPDDEGYALINTVDNRVACFAATESTSAVRGHLPDIGDSGRHIPANAALSHRRFSIIDLSDAAHQPFVDRDDQCCLVYNGEIYNYLELRQELEGLGSRFMSTSDTEVVVEAYKQWGTACFNRFNGFWALALFDRKNRRFILCRDRLGKKPLYYTHVNGTMYFASEIKSLLTVPAVHSSRRMNETAAWNWLAFGRKNLDDGTFFEGILTLPRATYMVVNPDGRTDVTTYWKLPSQRRKESEISVHDAAGRLVELVDDAVKLRLRSDVPVGLELSGGLDSSILAVSLGRNGARNIHAFTVRFPQPESNEEPYARAVARHVGIPLTVIDPAHQDFWSTVKGFTRLEEEPYHSPNLRSNQEVWQAMRGVGVKVSLNGAAGDECFGGYRSHYWTSQLQLIKSGRIGEYVSNALHYSEGRNPLVSALLPFASLAARGLVEMSPFTGRAYRAVNLKPRHRYHAAVLIHDRLYSEMSRTLMPYWLASGDRGYMGVPLEVRAPFLDYRIVEFAFTLPVTYLVRDGWHKWILRKAFEKHLPADIVWRRKKAGFPFPIGDFLAGGRDVVSSLVAGSRNPFVEIRDVSRIDWKCLSFLLWYECFVNENTDLFDKVQSRFPSNRGSGFVPEFLARDRG